METKKILIRTSGSSASTAEACEQALTMADEFIKALSLPSKKALHIRLLVEETVGMVRSMVDDFHALFWLETDEKECRIRLTAKTEMDAEKKSGLLSVSSSGKNAAAVGFMGKVREIIENSILNYDSVIKLQQQYGAGSLDYAYLGAGAPTYVTGGTDAALMWSLGVYRKALDEADKGGAEEEAKDELERSIVASVADDVIVGVKKDDVELTIIKLL